MRVDLDCPFSEKDQVKSLGARWDPARRVWYINDVEDLMPFARWIPKLRHLTSQPARAQRFAGPHDHSPRRTGPATPPVHCGCNVLPWEPCEHTPAYQRRVDDALLRSTLAANSPTI